MTAPPPRAKFGAALQEDGSTVFRLWAPSAGEASVEIERGREAQQHAMAREAGGWHVAKVPATPAGTRYRYVVNGQRVPDPASRWQPDDVHGASVVTGSERHVWRDQAWQGRPWHEAVIYELHVGTFTPQGTYTAAIERLADLAALGITAIELMPVGEFPGRRGWGYDVALPFAPDAAYGQPDDLKALIDRAHALGLMMFLDVVYNHFGPDGNYLHGWCPEFFNPLHRTPWGSSINFDGEQNGPVRQYFVENARYWIEEFHFDGLRVDAVHQIRDDSPVHIISEIAAALRAGPGATRQVHLVLENDGNDARMLERSEHDRMAMADAQWNDDFHHAAHVALTGETAGHLVDFSGSAPQRIARSLAQGFVYQGERSAYRDAPRGTPSAHLPSNAFVSFLQNHDQIGNRAFGERITHIAEAEPLSAIYACLLLSPHIPMFFMGEEFAASTPFLFFCDFEGELARQVADGRRHEFFGFPGFDDASSTDRIPDPNHLETFERSKLRWEERETSPHSERLALIRELLSLRRLHLTPRLAGQISGGSFRTDRSVVRIEWKLGDGTPWQVLANLGATPITAGKVPAGEIIYQRHTSHGANGKTELGPYAVMVVNVAA